MVGIQTAETPKSALLPRRAHAAMKFPIKVQFRRTFIPLPAPWRRGHPCRARVRGLSEKVSEGNFFGI